MIIYDCANSYHDYMSHGRTFFFLLSSYKHRILRQGIVASIQFNNRSVILAIHIDYYIASALSVRVSKSVFWSLVENIETCDVTLPFHFDIFLSTFSVNPEWTFWDRIICSYMKLSVDHLDKMKHKQPWSNVIGNIIFYVNFYRSL